MRYLADTFGARILWVDPFPARLPRVSDIFRQRNVYNQGTKEHPGIQICSHRSPPVEPLANCSKMYQKVFLRKLISQIDEFIGTDTASLGIGKPSCLAKALLETGSFHRSFYDAMDDYPEFHTGISQKYIVSMENHVASHVDDVFVSSHFLRDKFISRNSRVHLVPNGYDSACASVTAGVNNADSTAPSRPILGYVGTIYHWFDWQLVILIAELVPDIVIQLVGPVLGEIPRSLPANISILPPCSNVEAARYMKSFDVGLIPFLRNNATRAVDPIKYYEYRSLGLPVISTVFGDMAYKDGDPGLFMVSELAPERLRSVVLSALAYKSAPGDFSLHETSTWASRFRQVDVFSEILGKP